MIEILQKTIIELLEMAILYIAYVAFIKGIIQNNKNK